MKVRVGQADDDDGHCLGPDLPNCCPGEETWAGLTFWVTNLEGGTVLVAADVSFWSFLWYAFAGLVIGVLAKLFMPGKQNMNIFATILLGVIAAILGAFLWNAIFVDQEGVAWIGGVVVAVILLWLYSRFAPKPSPGE